MFISPNEHFGFKLKGQPEKKITRNVIMLSEKYNYFLCFQQFDFVLEIDIIVTCLSKS